MTQNQTATRAAGKISTVAKHATWGTAVMLGAATSAEAGLIEVVGPSVSSADPITLKLEGSSVDQGFFSYKGVDFLLNKNGSASSISVLEPTKKKFGGAAISDPSGSPFLSVFDEGAAISKASGPFNDIGFFYIADNGEFADIGDTGFIGLFVSVFDGEEQNIYYGWAEATRGSLEVSRVFFQDERNEPAAIPITDPVDPVDPIDVPEPATLPLIALGAAGLMAMRRRKAA